MRRDVLCLSTDIHSLFVNKQSSSSSSLLSLSLLSLSLSRSLVRSVARSLAAGAHTLLVLSVNGEKQKRACTYRHTLLVLSHKKIKQMLRLLKIKMETSGAHGT